MTLRNRILLPTILVGLSFVASLGAQKAEPAATALRAAIDTETVDGDLKSAIAQFKTIVDTYKNERPVVATALVHMAECYQKLGDAQAKAIYQRLLRDYADQKDAVAIARQRLTRNTAASPQPVTATQQVLIGPNSGSWSRISRDGRYVSLHEGGNLAVRDLATGLVRAVTSDGVSDGPEEQYPLGSVFSPDGKLLAYEWFFDQALHGVLRVVATAENSTTSRRTVYDNPEVGTISPTDWSPDGRLISAVIRRKDRTAQIGVVNVADGSLRVLKTVDWTGVGGLRFSPDSSLLAYHRPKKEGGFERDVLVIAVDGTREMTAAATPGDDFVLEWAPDGERLLIASDRGGSMAIWAVPFRGGAPKSPFELVKSDVGDINSLGLTRAGVLYYHLAPGGANIYVAQFDAVSGQLSSAPVQPIQQFKGLNTQPDWSGDGKYLSYVSRREVPAPINVARPILLILSIETGTVRELYPTLSYMGFPRWSPDNRQFIARGADLKGRDGIVRIDAATGDASLVVPNEVCSGLPYWSPDSRSFFCYRLAEEQIAQVDVSSGAVLRTFPGASQGAAVSPDGRYLLHFSRAGEPRSLKLLTLSSGESRELLRIAPPESQFGNLSSFSWTPDSRSVVFSGKLRGDSGMWLVPIDGSEPHKIKIDIGPISTWRFNSRTGQVAFSTDVVPRLELWKMEHFLPEVSAKR